MLGSNRSAKTQARSRYHQLSSTQIETVSKLQNEIVGWGICEVGTAMKAEAMSGRGEEWSIASSPLDFQAQHTATFCWPTDSCEGC